MGISIPTLQNSLAVALATVPALLTVLWSIWQHNKRIDDVRDTLRAEIAAKAAQLGAWQPEIQEKLANIDYRFGRMEEDVREIRRIFSETQTNLGKVNQVVNATLAEQKVDRERWQRTKEDLSGFHTVLQENLKRFEEQGTRLKAEFRKDLEVILGASRDK